MQNTTPTFDLSIVIVTYNNRDLVVDCLTSLARALRSYTAQLFIIDNHSSDGTRDILQNEETWKPLQGQSVQCVLNAKNVGYTCAVNQGLRCCEGRYVLLLNPDVVFPYNPFPTLFSCFESPEVGVVAPQLQYPNGRVQPSCRRLPRKEDVIYEALGASRLFSGSARFNGWRMPDFDHRSSRDVAQPQGAFLLARHEVLSRVGILDERFPMFFSDVDWCRRVLEHGFRIHFCANAAVVHHKGASVYPKRARMMVSSHRSFYDYFLKYDVTTKQRVASRFIYLVLLLATPLRLLAFKFRS